MALLNRLSEEYNALISAQDAIDEYETKFEFEFIKSRLIQEEQRITMRTQSAQAKSETASLLNTPPGNNSRNGGSKSRSSYYCNFCKRTVHNESRCWAKLPHLKLSRNNRPSPNPALYQINPTKIQSSAL